MFGEKRKARILPMSTRGLSSSWQPRQVAPPNLGGRVVRAAKKAILALPLALVVALVTLLAMAMSRRSE